MHDASGGEHVEKVGATGNCRNRKAVGDGLAKGSEVRGHAEALLERRRGRDENR